MNSDSKETAAPPPPHPIKVEFFSDRSKKTTNLINNDDPRNHLKGRNLWYSYSFSEPVYITGILIECEGYSSWNKFEILIDHIDGTKHDERVDVSGNGVSLRLGKLASAFSFRPEQKLLANPIIRKVVVTGLTLSEFHEYEWAIKNHDKREKSIASKESRVEELEQKLSELKSEHSSINDSVGKARGELETLQSENSKISSKITELQKQQKDLSSLIQTKEAERREILADIDKKQRELSDITHEVRLFPSEIVGFVKEGNRNIKSYALIGLPFAVILGIILVSMFSSAVDLTQLWRREENIDIWVIILTRLPFLLLALALIETCSYVIARLIFEIMRINRQRLELSKLSIIAKDVSTASSHNTDLTDEERFVEETKLRMQLLREHMANYPEQDFVYKGSAIMTAIINVAEKITGKKE